METFSAYLPFIDLAGLILVALLVWRANRLNKFLADASDDAETI